jgi:hypothetical protein
MTGNLHPAFEHALRTIFPARRVDPPYEFIPDTREIVAPRSGVIPDDMPVAVLSEMGGDEVRIGYLMAAASEMRSALMLFMEAGVGNSTDYRKQAQAHAATTRALAKADGIV